jgi:hypothetical protein
VTGLPTGYPITPKVQAFSGGTLYALGEMTNVYGGAGESLTYTTAAHFNFNYAANSQLRLAIGGDAAINTGFDSSELEVLIDGVESYDRSFATLSDWESFLFPGGGPNVPIDIGTLLAGGMADVEIVYTLVASSNNGFQFDYAFGTVPGAAAVPTPAALPLFATGLGILGLLGWRRAKKPAASFPAA